MSFTGTTWPCIVRGGAVLGGQPTPTQRSPRPIASAVGLQDGREDCGVAPDRSALSLDWPAPERGAGTDTGGLVASTACRISSVAASGCERNETCEAGTSTMVAWARSAMNRWSAGGIALSSVPSRYQQGVPVFQAGGPEGPV